MAVEARLLGRLRLLTIEAVIDVAEPVSPRIDSRPAPVATHRRQQTEALLVEAASALEQTRNGGSGWSPARASEPQIARSRPSQ